MLGKRIVTIGGGTGGFTVNRGLHGYPVHPTAICTVFDSGGSTGVLRDEFGSLPQGDIRKCLLALADDANDTLRTVFNHRFAKNGSSLSDHSLGNLLLLAAEQNWGPIEGIRRVSKLLGVQGDVLPVSINSANICAELSDGSTVCGEGIIDTRSIEDERTIRRIWLEPAAFITREAVDAIIAADVVVLGPGDLYTSIIPNLLVSGIQEAIRRSNAKLVYVANIMTKWSETRGYTAADLVETLLAYDVGRDGFDVVIVNTASPSAELLARYAEKDKSFPVDFSPAIESRLSGKVGKIVRGNFLNRAGVEQGLIRHDSHTLAYQIVQI